MQVLFSLLLLSSCLVCAFGCIDALKGECSACAPVNPVPTDGSLTEYCTACNGGYFLYEEGCYANCGFGEYFSPYSCEPCDDPCADCSGSATACTACHAGSALPLHYSRDCYSICPASSFQSSSTTCDSCPTWCQDCTSSTYCSTCKTGGYKYKDMCYNPCPSGTYGDASFNCQPCVSPCNTCGTETICRSCVSGFLFYDGSQCLESCPFGYYANNGNCTVCPGNCASCTSASVCTSCKSSFLLDDVSCVTTCPTTPVLKYAVDGVCKKCTDHCKTCGPGAICSACQTGWSLFNNTCLDECPVGYYSDSNGICQVCPVGCTNCTDANTCGGCEDDYVFYKNTCPVKCPDGYYNNTGFCESCATECKTCESLTVCFTCAVGYVYFNQTCPVICPDGYYDLKGICTTCPIGCTTCTSAKLCQTCAWGYNIHMTDVCALDITEEEIKAVKGLATTTEATGTASNVLSSIYGFMNSGDPTAMFMGSLAKMLQYVRYINIEYPPKIKLMFGLQSRANGTSESIILKTQKKIEDTSKRDTLANNFGYYKLTSSFISNCFQSLGTLAGIIAGIGVNYLLLYLLSPASKIHQICKSVMGILKWNLFLLMFCGMIGDIVFFSSFEFQKANFDNGFSVMSFVICLLMNFLSIFIFYKLVQVNLNLQKSRSSRIAMRHEADFMKDAESKWENCKVFFNSYKNQKLSQQAFMIFFLIRVLSFYLTIAYLSAYPFFQIILITVVSLLIVTYLILIRPFKSILNNINQIVFELIILAFNGCVLILAALETSNSGNYPLRLKLETAMLNINLAAGFISTAFVLLKAIVVVRDIYKDWKLKKSAKKPRFNLRKDRLANRISQQTNNNSAITSPDIQFAHSNLSSQNIMDQTYDNQSFDLNNSPLQNRNNSRNMTSNTPSSSSFYQENHQERQEYNRNQRNQSMRQADFESTNQGQKMKKSSTSSSKRIKKRATRLQDRQVSENKEKGLDFRNQTREDDLNRGRTRRVQKQNRYNEIDIISL